MSERTEYINGLRQLADWLEQHPDVEPQYQKLLLALHTNSAVEAFAAEHGLTVAHDDEGNASCDLTFGPVVYHAYGYVDFAEHSDRHDERRAREWAAKHGMEITESGGETEKPEWSLWSCGECHAINNDSLCMVCRAPRPDSKGGAS